MVFLFISVLFLTKALTKICFVLFCPYSNLSPTKKGVWSISALILTKTLPERVFFFIFALILKKSLNKKLVLLYFCPYSNKKPATKGIFPIFVPIPAITLPIKVFSLFCPYASQSPTIKCIFVYFCPYSNQSFVYFCPYSDSHQNLCFTLFLPLF